MHKDTKNSRAWKKKPLLLKRDDYWTKVARRNTVPAIVYDEKNNNTEKIPLYWSYYGLPCVYVKKIIRTRMYFVCVLCYAI